ncbi:AI-2E family transporter [Meridianimarinicoccus aquatilis]|uniref:AI-2E family transporter n=1 Tax=Meridianimarinicoccus aquatilis TaxID=2552766 RepID=A0A4R6APT8_9RHOB|nr:AI-2E family transporter [Fluviibacterium aquatile]QIE42754.1 AI-2E family transporter [Rhodobacteraceae bacterium SC52]TDL86090.1 AI-2E family transporter [Fluviibacterium aquatile]
MLLRDAFHMTALTISLGWLLVVGKAVILPVVIAIMLTYVLVGAKIGMQRFTLLKGIPGWLAYVLVLTIFGLALAVMGLVAVSNLRNIAQTELAFEGRFTDTIAQVAAFFGMDGVQTPEGVRDFLIDSFDITGLSLNLLSSVASISGYIVLIVTYIVFMVAERGPMQRKIELVLPHLNDREPATKVFRRINQQIVTYLSTKTMINVIVGALSYMVMLLLGIENAVFWAFVIAILNYIPYVGSLLGVGVVISYTVLATADLQLTLIALVALTACQVYVGNWLEPRVMSRSLNLSPLTVMLALVLWSTLWGLTGAIIAVPMTSILLIAFAQFPSTRSLAVLASRDGNLY